MAEIYPIKECDTRKLEVFFDYICPYCYRGHKNLLELLKKYTDVSVIWRPCETHPRPEEHGQHSDLAIAGFYFIVEHNGDFMKYNSLMFAAVFEENKNIEDIAVLRSVAKKCGADGAAFAAALEQGKYKKLVEKGNEYAWMEKKFAAMPSYARGKKQIGSDNGVMVTAEELEDFIKS